MRYAHCTALYDYAYVSSQTPADYVTAVVVILANICLNLMFRSTWLDRVILYTINLMLPASGEVIKRLDEVPGKMPPIHWLLFISTNVLLIALGYWYYVRKATRADNEWRQNVLAVGVLAINVTVGVAVGALSYVTYPPFLINGSTDPIVVNKKNI